MSTFSDVVGRAIIDRYFPNADPSMVKKHSLFLSPPLVMEPYLSSYNFIKEGDDTMAAISEFQRAISTAWRIYESLPVRIRSESGISKWEFRKIAVACGAALPPDSEKPQSPAIHVMRENARKASRLTAQAMSADHPAKISLVENARDAWRDFTGSEPPLKPSEGSAFLKFVQDIIEGTGNSWGADKAIVAWRTARDKFGG